MGGQVSNQLNNSVQTPSASVDVRHITNFDRIEHYKLVNWRRQTWSRYPAIDDDAIWDWRRLARQEACGVKNDTWNAHLRVVGGTPEGHLRVFHAPSKLLHDIPNSSQYLIDLDYCRHCLPKYYHDNYEYVRSVINTNKTWTQRIMKAMPSSAAHQSFADKLHIRANKPSRRMYTIANQSGYKKLGPPCIAAPPAHRERCHLRLGCKCPQSDQDCCRIVYNNMLAPGEVIDMMKNIISENARIVPFQIRFFRMITLTVRGNCDVRDLDSLSPEEEERGWLLSAAADKVEEEFKKAFQDLVMASGNAILKGHARRVCRFGTPRGEGYWQFLGLFGLRELLDTTEFYELTQDVRRVIKTVELDV